MTKVFFRKVFSRCKNLKNRGKIEEHEKPDIITPIMKGDFTQTRKLAASDGLLLALRV